METLYKVGDKVKIRDNLELNECYEECYFVDDMKEFKGKIVTITDARKDYDNIDNYNIEGCRESLCWTNSMFENIDDEAYKNY